MLSRITEGKGLVGSGYGKLFLGSLASMGFLISSANAGNLLDYIHFELETKSFYSTETGQLDQSSSHLGISVGNSNLGQILDELKAEKRSRFIFQFTAKISVVPTLFEAMAAEKIYARIGEEIDKVRKSSLAAAEPQIYEKVRAGLMRDPNFSLLPPADQQQIIDRSVTGALDRFLNETLNPKLAEAQKMKKEEQREHLKQVVTETTFQEVAVVIGHVFASDTGNAVLYLKTGKYTLNMGARVDASGYTEANKLRAGGDRIQNEMRIFTGAVNLGFSKEFGSGEGDWRLRSSIFICHYRPGFISGTQYLAEVAGMNEKEFENQKKYWQIDSYALQTILEKEGSHVYLTFGYFNDKKVIMAGGVLKVSKSGELLVNFQTGETQGLKTGVDVLFAYRVLKPLRIYVGIDYLDKAADALITSEKRSWLAGVLGLNFMPLSGKFNVIGIPVEGEMIFTAEGQNRVYFKEPTVEKGKKESKKLVGTFGTQVNVRF